MPFLPVIGLSVLVHLVVIAWHDVVRQIKGVKRI